MECKDHLENTYRSITEMCEAYGVLTATFNARIKSGMSLEDALTLKRKPSKKWHCFDHLGNIYPSVEEMCNHYGVKVNSYYVSLKRGHTLKEALSTGKRIVTDHLGNEYPSDHAMCRAYNISYTTYLGRRNKGLSLEDALTMTRATPMYRVEDYLGNIFDSTAEMCRQYNIPLVTYKDRIRKGWSKKDALLGKPIVKHPKQTKKKSQYKRKKIEIGKSDSGYFVFPEDSILKSGLSEDKCVSIIMKYRKRYPKSELTPVPHGAYREDVERLIKRIDEKTQV